MASDKTITVTLKVWRQKNAADKGHFEIYKAKDINDNMSFLRCWMLLMKHLH